ncbi:MAG: DUF3768 domain-containing protein [Phyllobacteriaceae bacterium]|nr:DUF3768 domain-containing protein [Phyllobacteriaceae bacterium]
MTRVPTERTLAIRTLNNRLRMGRIGGRIILSAGITALDESFVREILVAVACFEGFTPDNDPWGEHDCGLVEWEGNRVLFKIDYYDPTFERLSDDPTDPCKTERVMTVMFATEY